MKTESKISFENKKFSKVTLTKRVELKFWKNCAMIAFGILLASYTYGASHKQLH